MDKTTLRVDARFDGGNISCVDTGDPSNIRLEIRADSHADYHQWFYFRATHIAGQACHFSILNAGTSSYPEAWPDGAVFASVDRRTWKRVSTVYESGILSFSITQESDSVYVALHTPYSQEQHLDLISTALLRDSCTMYASSDTVSGRQLEVLRVGRAEQDAPVIWVIARQHPAESMAEWFMEGLIERLLGQDEPISLASPARFRIWLEW